MCKPPVIGSYSTPFKAGVGRHFDPRPPREERRTDTGPAPYQVVFLSTLPARGATFFFKVRNGDIAISIHAPREGSDTACLASPLILADFYPRSPRGERRWTPTRCARPSMAFLSTLPARGATDTQAGKGEAAGISIHAPREGSDGVGQFQLILAVQFLSTLPVRGATSTTGRYGF